jgi:hypothetical protein
VKKFVIAVTGGTVVLVGIAMIILPGPAFIVIPAGLALLATEFLWARRALCKCQNIAVETKRRAKHWWPFGRNAENVEPQADAKSESPSPQPPCHQEKH